MPGDLTPESFREYASADCSEVMASRAVDALMLIGAEKLTDVSNVLDNETLMKAFNGKYFPEGQGDAEAVERAMALKRVRSELKNVSEALMGKKLPPPQLRADYLSRAEERSGAPISSNLALEDSGPEFPVEEIGQEATGEEESADGVVDMLLRRRVKTRDPRSMSELLTLLGPWLAAVEVVCSARRGASSLEYVVFLAKITMSLGEAAALSFDVASRKRLAVLAHKRAQDDNCSYPEAVIICLSNVETLASGDLVALSALRSGGGGGPVSPSRNEGPQGGRFGPKNGKAWLPKKEGVCKFNKSECPYLAKGICFFPAVAPLGASKRARCMERESPTEGASSTSNASREGGAESYWDRFIPSETWDAHVKQVQGCLEEKVTLMDGSGLPHMGHWAEESYSFEKATDPETTEWLSMAVTRAAQDWLGQPGATAFMESFVKLDGKDQGAAAHLWDSYDIKEAGSKLSGELALILQERGYGSAATLLQNATERSPLRGRLLEAVLRCTAPEQGVEDLAGPLNVMGGAQAGVSIPCMAENPQVWPAFVEKPRRRGEPDEMVLWDGEPLVSYQLKEELATLGEEKIQEEIEHHRMEAISFDEARNRGAKVITSLKAIWKNKEKTKVRMISDFRRLKEVAQFVTDCATATGQEVRGESPLGFMLKYDIKGAYRLIDLRECERKNTAVTDPRPLGQVLWDISLPFGLSSSCLIFSRYNSGVHRAQYHLVGSRSGKGGGLCYIDDSLWWAGSVAEVISLLLLPLAFGMDLEYSKITISASLVEFLGYDLGLDWEAQKGSIALPKQKRDMIRSMIQDARRGGSITRADLEVLLGRLNFACQLVVEHKPRLASLYAALAMTNKLELRKRTIGGALEQDMMYFYDILSRPLVMEPALMVESQWSIVTDGCLHGIGGLVVGPDESTQAWFSISRSDYPQL
ncbi:hypothetical protein FOL47_000609 [Perkinsus chesapeaki]|uniref:Reverse transcriptase domain-containing protein n=1 Tax=Perkinsus chesapeaki TaxID=330153 RepID=A0A7J6KW88_PERCH|nr:hypothetical protein FOL47_000609 [Perkinsus chesapeaki]